MIEYPVPPLQVAALYPNWRKLLVIPSEAEMGGYFCPILLALETML
jgi:hypothetical protein